MLAQNFLTAEVLGITEVEVDALVTTLGMLERGEIEANRFNMEVYMEAYTGDCGTLACICGWAHLVSKGLAFPEVATLIPSALLDNRLPANARRLFTNGTRNRVAIPRDKITTSQAAVALRNYLTTGEPNWEEALSA